MALFASLSCPDPQIMLFGKRIPVPGSTHDGAAAVKEEEDQRLLSPRGFDEVGVSFGTSSSGTSDEEEENQGFAMNGDVKEKVSVTTGETSCTAAMAVKEAPLHQHGHDGNHSQQQDHHHQQQLEEVEEDKALRKPDKLVQCPRCHSLDTKFCYFNNYNVNQPRHFCKHCQRYWTAGGTLRNVPVGAGKRKSKHPMRQGLSPHGLLYTKEDRVDPLVSTPPLKLKLDLFERTQLVSESGFTKPSEIKDLGLDLGCGGHQDVNPELLNLQSAHVKVGEFKASQLNTHIGSSQSFKSRGPETSSCNVESNLHQFSKASSKSKDVQPSNTYVGYTGVRGLQAISHSGVFEPIEVDNTKRAHTGDPVINNKRAHTGDPVRAHDEMVSNCNTNRILSDQALPCRPPDGWNNGGGLAVPAMESLWPYLFNMYYTEMSHQGPPVMNSNTLWPWPPFAATPVFGPPQGWGLPCIGTVVPTVDSAQNAIARTSAATAATILGKHPLQDEMDGNSLCNL